MSTPPDLPPGQADRLATLLEALGPIPISDAEWASLTWLAGFEAATVEHLADVILLARAETARVIAQDVKAGQLVDLCEWAGIDPGQDPHAALLAHLRTWRTGR